MLSILVHLHFFASPPLIITNNDDGVFSFVLANYVKGLPDTALFLLYHFVVIIQAIRLNRVLNDLRMFQQNNYTVAMSYVLFSGILLQWNQIAAALFANSLLIWLFIKLSRLYNHPSPKTLLFNTGLIVGVSVICYHPTAILILVVLFSLAVVRPFRLAEWLVLLIGILLPYYFLFSWLFLNDSLSTIPTYLPYLKLNNPITEWSPQVIFRYAVLGLHLLLGLYFWQKANNRMVIQIRKNWGVMTLILLILLPIPFLFWEAGILSAYMILIPLAAFAGNTFSNTKKLVFPNIVFLITVLIIIYNIWWQYKN